MPIVVWVIHLHAGGVGGGVARGDEPAIEERLRALEERLEQVEQRNRILERKNELAAEKAAEKAKSAVVFTATPGRGIGVALADNRFSLNLRFRAQARETLTWLPDGKRTSEIQIRTIRLWVTGNVLSSHLKYGVQLAFGGGDFEAGSSTPLFDAFVEYTRLRDLRIKVGQYFVPFDRLRTVREFALQLVDRPQVVRELTLDRDVGLSLSSEDLFGSHGVLAYHLGIFGGEGRNRFAPATVGGLYVGRIAIRPFGAFDDDSEGDLGRLGKPRLAIGFGGAYNQATNRQRSTTGTTYTLGTFDYIHAATDLIFKYAGFYLAGEVVYRRARQNLVEGMKDGKTIQEWSRSGWGYVAQASYLLVPKLEVVGRWGQLFARGDTDPAFVKALGAQNTELGGGINIYLNGHFFKLQADYFYLYGADRSLGTHQARIQLDASF